MISINIEVISQKTGKNLSQIAREAGINRNTIQAMALGKVNGIKFETLEKLCQTFALTPADILVFTTEAKIGEVKPRKRSLYKQEGGFVPFTTFPGFVAAIGVRIPDEKQSSLFGRAQGFYKENYGELYFDEAALYHSAKTLYQTYKDRDVFNVLYKQFFAACTRMEAVYASALQGRVTFLSREDLLAYFREVEGVHYEFWNSCIFIDTFDAGFDREAIQDIATQYRLSAEEVQSLTTPVDLTFSSERRLAFLKIAQRLKGKSMSHEELLVWIKAQSDVRAYKQEFDYTATNYASIKHLTDEQIVDELGYFLAHEKEGMEEFQHLLTYKNRRLQEIERICKAHRLSENPLWFFERLIFWRETRKKYTLMGVHALHEVLSGIERLTGIPYKHLQFMTFDEVPYVLRGQLTADELHSRREKGILLDFEKGSYRIHYGEEAISLRKEFEEELASQNTAQVIYGQVASQGYARGIARVILDQSQFDRFNEGEILVTGMTRPEFVPLMKKAAAIVTNEGGVTCHAAIVSRELGKPCIIGTKNATSLIPDGATIEVRANHGTVRVL